MHIHPLLVVGQFMEALLSGKYDLNRVALIITQTGGGCRATNYIGFIRSCFRESRNVTDSCYFNEVPVLKRIPACISIIKWQCVRSRL